MKLQRQANVNVMTAALIWGVLLMFAIRAAENAAASGAPLDILWRFGDLLALALYPVLAFLLLRQKAGLGVNAFLFAAVGSILVGMGVFVLAAFQDGAWLEVGLGLLGLWMLSRLAIPAFERIPAVRNEWASPVWRRVNDSSLAAFLFLRFPSLDDLADR